MQTPKVVKTPKEPKQHLHCNMTGANNGAVTLHTYSISALNSAFKLRRRHRVRWNRVCRTCLCALYPDEAQGNLPGHLPPCC